MELLEAIVDPVAIAVGGEQIRHGRAIRAIHGEGELPQRHAPRVLLAHSVERPIAKAGLRHVRRGDRRAVRHDGRLVHRSRRHAAERVAGKSSQIHRHHRGVRPRHAAFLSGIGIKRVRPAIAFRQQGNAIAIRVGRRAIGERAVVILLVGIRHAIGIRVTGEQICHRLPVHRSHREGDLRQGHAPRIQLPDAIERPIAEGGVGREIRGGDHRAGRRNCRLVHSSRRHAAQHVAGISRPIE